MSVLLRDIMTDDFQIATEETGIHKIREILQSMPYGDVMVTDAAGRLVGIIGFVDIKDVDLDLGLDMLINARDVARPHPETLAPEDNLEDALALMEVSAEDHLPVVDEAMGGTVVGVVNYKRVLRAYNRALMQAHAEEHGES